MSELYSMRRDIRQTELYREAETHYRTTRKPGSGLISDAAEVSTNGTHVAFAGTLVEALSGVPPTRICLTDLGTGDTRVLTFGPNVDRSPKFSPDGRCIAFLSDRHRADDFQLHFLDLANSGARAAPRVKGWVEYLHWSPDGTRVLLGVAGHGADVSGGQGAVTSKMTPADEPSWMPTVDGAEEVHRWRRVWIYEASSQGMRQVGPLDSNIWEAAWCGNDSYVAVASHGPGEGLWYSAHLCIVDIASGHCRRIYTPQEQIGLPAASPCGKHVAIVEGLCSDRGIVAGEVRLIELSSGASQCVDVAGVDVTCAEWRSDRQLLLAGHRGLESVLGLYDADQGTFTEVWCSAEISTAGRYMTVSGLGQAGDCVLVGEGFLRAPELAVIRRGEYQPVQRWHSNCDEFERIASVERLQWNSPDGLQIEGWLLRPRGPGSYPLVMNVHGGPVWHWRPLWLARGAGVVMLLKRGYAIFLPNPRGSSGRGRAFARAVLGDLGGADAQDCLSGLDHLVERGIADSKRLGVTGGSYGGFMTSWLITQDARFAAAISVAPFTNPVTQHLIGNIPHFMALFLGDSYTNQAGKYFRSSPVMNAHRVTTPTLTVCGALDRCTPPQEALQFHNALKEQGVRSVLVTYPEEGHGVRKWPAAIDYAARVVAWFEEHMPPRLGRTGVSV
jgi:dipeptidyl aminopeptidase/acylaminoacyl peptidase